MNGRGNVTYATMEPCSPQMISDAIKRMAKQAGADPSRYSGVSARKGGLSTAVQAGAEEVILHNNIIKIIKASFAERSRASSGCKDLHAPPRPAPPV